MELFAEYPEATSRGLEQCNQVRLYLRVIMIADITHESGEYIPDHTLTGKWQSGSDLEWPRQLCPPKTHWAVFRHSLRNTVCRCTEATQPAHYAMTLDTPLGTWHEVKRYAWFSCYRTESAIYHRDEDQETFQVFKEKGTSFYHYAETVTELPIQSHPIACQTVGRTYWTHRGLRLTEKNPPCYPLQVL